MKNLLKYLVPIVIVAIALICDTGSVYSDIPEIPFGESSYELVPDDSDSPLTNSHLCLTRQISSASVKRLPCVGERGINNAALKCSSKFIKAGKVVNIAIEDFNQRESLCIHPDFLHSFHKLVRFGKLVV